MNIFNIVENLSSDKPVGRSNLNFKIYLNLQSKRHICNFENYFVEKCVLTVEEYKTI